MKNSGRCKKIILVIILLAILPVKNVNASGGEEMEGSVLEKYLLRNGIGETKELFDGFQEMDYVLFLETKALQGTTNIYYRYGIYGNFTGTEAEGENIYFQLTQKITGNEISLSTEREWRQYSGDRIWENNYRNTISDWSVMDEGISIVFFSCRRVLHKLTDAVYPLSPPRFLSIMRGNCRLCKVIL